VPEVKGIIIKKKIGDDPMGHCPVNRYDLFTWASSAAASASAASSSYKF